MTTNLQSRVVACLPVMSATQLVLLSVGSSAAKSVVRLAQRSVARWAPLPGRQSVKLSAMLSVATPTIARAMTVPATVGTEVTVAMVVEMAAAINR
ncbi:hypothetical protein BTE28158_03789 [Burkholderia territorii]|nr:hypothetical protein BTE28158_03789 [Burkholderia territorii]